MKKTFLTFLLIYLYINLLAGVNPKNGNFYVSYTDFILYDTIWQNVEITRTYNSKVSYNGSFGYGWGTLFDTYLIASYDNSITIVMHGAGARNKFESELTNEQSIQEEIEIIIKAAYKAKKIETPEEEIEFRNKLSSNSEWRFYYYKRYLKSGLIDSLYHEPGITFFSQACGCIGEYRPGYSYTISTEQGYDYYDYVHEYKIYSFNKSGKIVKVTDMDNPDFYYTFSYEDDRKIRRLDTYNGQGLLFLTDSLNRIVEITSIDSTERAIFKYNGKGLAYTMDIDSNEYAHEYDKKYNMTKIIYNPGEKNLGLEDSRKMFYSQDGNLITKVIDRDSTYTTYAYPGELSTEYGTEIKRFNKYDSLLYSKSQYWFIKINDHGNRWTYKTMDIENNDSTTRIIHEISLKPMEVINSSGTYKYQYSPTGYLLEGTDPENNKAIFVHNSDNIITEIIFKDLSFKLESEGDEYKFIIFPDGSKHEIPIDSENENFESEFEDAFFKLKNLLDLCYYKIL